MTIGGVATRVHLLVAVLSYSRRLFVKAFRSERQGSGVRRRERRS